MPSPKYPLKPLLEQRDRMVDAAKSELGSAVGAREVVVKAEGRFIDRLKKRTHAAEEEAAEEAFRGGRGV